eukprot:UN14556
MACSLASLNLKDLKMNLVLQFSFVIAMAADD